MNEKINKEVFREKMKKIMFKLNKYKALGLDRFPTRFFKAN